MRFLKLTAFFLILIFSFQMRAENFSGSVSVSVDQRFFNDERFGNKNGFSEGFIPSLDLTIGFYEFPFRIEPVASFGFIKNSARACAVLEDGETCDPKVEEPSEDRFHYQLYTAGLGVRWKTWSPDFFIIIPYFQAQGTFRYVRMTKKTSNGDQVNRISGSDFGADLLAGLEISFMYDQTRETEMNLEWGIRDFGLSLHGRYLPAGVFKRGMGEVSDSGGWSFGAGLIVDW